MTVIAWDGRTLAADKRCGPVSRTVTKLRRAKNGAICGMTGNAPGDAELFAWYDSGAFPADFPASQRDQEKCSMLISIEPDKVVRCYDGAPVPFIVEDRFAAFGSGRDFALAAMYLGENAEKAVEVACAFVTDCGNGIDTLRLE